MRAPARALQRADAAARALELDALGVVHNAIENGVGEGRLADDVVPAADRQLACEQGRGAAVAILAISSRSRRCSAVMGSGPPIVEDRQAGPVRATERARVAVIAAGRTRGRRNAAAAVDREP